MSQEIFDAGCILAVLGCLGISAVVLICEIANTWLASRRLRLDARRLNDCKPGCFMMNEKETIE
jgi:hypothetical protein